jgi:hypothetical protein
VNKWPKVVKSVKIDKKWQKVAKTDTSDREWPQAGKKWKSQQKKKVIKSCPK